MQAWVFSSGGSHPKGLKGSSAAEEDWWRQGGPHKGLCTSIIGSCKRTLSGVTRLGHAKVEIVGIDVVLPSLGRP